MVSLLIKLQAALLKKWDFDTGAFCEFCEIFKNNFFTELIQETAS